MTKSAHYLNNLARPGYRHSRKGKRCVRSLRWRCDYGAAILTSANDPPFTQGEGLNPSSNCLFLGHLATPACRGLTSTRPQILAVIKKQYMWRKNWWVGRRPEYRAQT